jgi:hypothetical protein
MSFQQVRNYLPDCTVISGLIVMIIGHLKHREINVLPELLRLACRLAG